MFYTENQTQIAKKSKKSKYSRLSLVISKCKYCRLSLEISKSRVLSKIRDICTSTCHICKIEEKN